MCGFIATFSNNGSIIDHFEKNVEALMELVERRGPSFVKNTRGKNFFISHALLAINDFVPQPVEDEKYLLFMNGEIYNKSALESKNDTMWLLEFLKTKRPISELDGEFIIVSYDKVNDEIMIVSDPFATKPCFYTFSSEFLSLSSYQEPLIMCFGRDLVQEFPPNFYIKINAKEFKIKESGPVLNWDFEPKYRDFEKWNDSFRQSIQKRTSTDKNIFLGLSSGYDSGLIVAELLSLNKKFESYSIIGAEDESILRERSNIINSSPAGKSFIVSYDQDRYDRHLEFIKKNSSNYPYKDVNGNFIKWMLDDKAAVGLSMICEDAIKSNSPIYLSGQGADEIFSDYQTRGPHHGTIRGNFQGVRSKWTNFDMGFQRNFLAKEERIPGAWGIEARYPFLDKDVVQNFLWLNDNLKNIEYKQCLSQRLREHKFPFLENVKCGFNPLKSLPKGKILYGP